VSRRVAVLGALLVVSLFRGASAAAPPVQVHSSVDRTAIWVADRLTYTVDLVCDKGIDVLLDDLAKEKLRVNGLEILSSDSSATTDANERTTHRLRYVLTTYRVDSPALSIEPIAVRYYTRRPGQRLQDMAPAGEVSVPGAVVAFRSTLPDAQPLYALRDARSSAPRHPLFVRAQPIGLALVIISLAPALLVAGAAVRRRTARTSGRPSARRVRKEKLDRLERLRALDVGTEAERRHAYDEISTAVREHVAAVSGVPATGLTAAELGAALDGARARVPRETVTSLLASCDAARYGPPAAIPSAEQTREALAAAEQVLAGR
jgi:hypothetical protein